MGFQNQTYEQFFNAKHARAKEQHPTSSSESKSDSFSTGSSHKKTKEDESQRILYIQVIHFLCMYGTQYCLCLHELCFQLYLTLVHLFS